MAFFYTEAKKAEKAKPASTRAKRGPIPIASLNHMGCSVCPKDKDESLRSPKMAPEGPSNLPLLYLLGSSPSAIDDDVGNPFADKAGRAITKLIGGRLFDETRIGYIAQCSANTEDAGNTDVPIDVAQTECCRGRVVADIEASKPLVIAGIGDQVLRWATGMNNANAMRLRGSTMPVKIGKHVCWFYSLLYPNYVHKKNKYGKSEYELAMEHDVAELEAMLQGDDLQPAKVYSSPYDLGIEQITGQEPGDFQRLERALSDLSNLPRSGVDIETNGLRPYIQDPMILTAAVGSFQHTVAFSIDHPDGWGSSAQRKRVRDLFGEYLLFSGKKVAHNLSFEQEWLGYTYGSQFLRRTEWEDTMAMCHTLDEREGTKSLDVQTMLRFGFNLKEQSRVDVKRPKWWLEYPLKEILRYNGMDTKWTHLLADYYDLAFLFHPANQRAEYERKVRLCPTLVLTEMKGLPADIDFANKLEKDLAKQLGEVEAKIRRTPEVAKFTTRFGSFSPTNADHVLKLMRDVCDRPEVRRVDRDGKESFSSDEEGLSQIPSSQVPSAALVLEHRGIEKLRSTYLGPVLSGQVISADGLIHCKYGSMVAVTGRLNSYDPNIQNWPKRKHKEIRGTVYARLGHWLVAADYGQIEFRVVGMASEDTNLVKYCWTGYDVHGFWAQRMVEVYPEVKDWIVKEFGVDWDEKGMKTLRQEAKNKWVFPQLFGSSLHSCATQLHLPEWAAEDLGAEFWDQFPGVKKWQGKLLKSYERNLYVETLGGRRRRGPMTPNEIINMPIQGTAADIVLEGMNALSERADRDEDPELQPVLNVHDDLTFALSDQTMEGKIDIIVREMCLPRFDYINVPLVVELSVGPRWSELEEIAKYRSDELFGHRNPYK